MILNTSTLKKIIEDNMLKNIPPGEISVYQFTEKWNNSFYGDLHDGIRLVYKQDNKDKICILEVASANASKSDACPRVTFEKFRDLNPIFIGTTNKHITDILYYASIYDKQYKAHKDNCRTFMSYIAEYCGLKLKDPNTIKRNSLLPLGIAAGMFTIGLNFNFDPLFNVCITSALLIITNKAVKTWGYKYHL